MKKISTLILLLSLFFHTTYSQVKPNPFSQKGLRAASANSLMDGSYKGKIIFSSSLKDYQEKNSSASFPGLAVKSSVLKNRNQNLKIIKGKNGLPLMVKGLTKGSVSIKSNSRVSIADASHEYLKEIKDILQINDPEKEFKLVNSQVDHLNKTHIRLQQLHKGIPVYGSEIMLHSGAKGIELFNGRYFPSSKLNNVIPSLSTDQAVDIVIKDIKTLTKYREFTEMESKVSKYKGPEAELIIYHKDLDVKNEKLAWHITIRPNFMARWEYFVDAKTGHIIHKYDNTCKQGPHTATGSDLNGVNQTLNTYEVGGTYYLIDGSRSMFDATKSTFPDDPIGAIWTIDAQNTHPGEEFKAFQVTSADNQWFSKSTVSAHYNAGKAFEYFENVHNRNSINGEGGTIISFVNVADEDGSNLDNAFWNGFAMFYGNGNVAFKSLAGGMDVAGHEMTHGVVGSSANLEYQGQSGAINESFADIFGVMMDRDDWQIGEDVTLTSYIPSGALRDMEDPHNGGTSLSDNGYQPAHINEMYSGAEDNGGVHINSGIANKAFYNFATAVTNEKAEKVYYRALTQYLTKSSQFTDLRIAVVQAAADLHGENSTEVNAAKAAFDAVGITEGAETPTTPELPANQGKDYILVYNTDPADPNSLYIVDPATNEFEPISQTKLKSKPSVTDDGTAVIFVAADARLKFISLEDFTEDYLNEDPIWHNVVVSKDGNRLAAVSINQDSRIYVADLSKENGDIKEFLLYNPTSTDIVTNEVRYADAVEFDHSGEFIMYDAFNSIVSESGEDLSFWDVGFLKVWDNATNTFGDGKIQKLFTNLPAGASIGNPVFSKNSPNIIAFDYYDAYEDVTTLMTADIETGATGELTTSNTLTFPTFSKLDDKIAFTTLNVDGDTIINVVGLQEDKLNSSGTPSGLVLQAKWPVWFAVGVRETQPPLPPTGNENNVVSEKGVSIFPNPFRSNLAVTYEALKPAAFKAEVFDLQGNKIREYREEKLLTGKQIINLATEKLNNGVFVLKVRVGNNVTTHRIVRVD